MPPVSFLFRKVLTAASEEVTLLDQHILTAPAPIIVILLSGHIYDMFLYRIISIYFILLIIFRQVYHLLHALFNIKPSCFCAIKI